ncbi:MAG: molybdopterin molybdotransferase MoeA [Clostridia bacterium]|nr:molybdopterin molybdotransferase MoeA [Clostridia bacterium]
MLHVVSLSKAFEIIDKNLHASDLPTENVPLALSAGRTLAEDITGRENVPAFDRSTMDGYAVRAEDTFGAGETLPAMLQIAGEVKMGEKTDLALLPGACVKIPTGGMLPAGANAVVPVEYTDETANGLLLCYRAVSPGENVTRAGDDVCVGQTVLPEGTQLSPANIGVLAAMGITLVPVYRRPAVGILSTGSELVPADMQPETGEVRDVNAPMLAALFENCGCVCTQYGIIPDDEALILQTLARAAKENDVVLLSGGSSAGEADKTAEVLSRLGTVYCHGIAVKPGKPTVLGRINNTAVFGLPGHPAACYFMASLLVKRHIEALLRLSRASRTAQAVLAEHVSSNHGREELLCVRLANAEAIPVYGKSGVISLLSAADGFILIPRDCEGLQRGASVEVRMF